MNDTTTMILAVAFVAAGALIVAASQQQASDQTGQGADTAGTNDNTTGTDTGPGIVETIMSTTRNVFGLWRPPAAYADAIAQAEQQNGIPPDLLARLLYQECHWRTDIITGRKRSPAGAIGIAQFMPATARQFGIDPTDPYQSIAAAGRYLAQLYRQFGDWTQALAAYNWGPGNVARKGLGAAPAETVAYFTNILGDVNNANGTNLA